MKWNPLRLSRHQIIPQAPPADPSAYLDADGHEGVRLYRLMHRIMITMLLAGMANTLTGTVPIQETATARNFQFAAAGVILTMVLFLLSRKRHPYWVFQGVILFSCVLISAIMATANPVGTTSFFYLWPVLLAAYFGSVRYLVAVLALCTLGQSVALVVNPLDPIPAMTVTATTVSCALLGMLVVALHSHEGRLRRKLATAAHTDALTGLMNRRSYNPLVAHLVQQAQVQQRPMSLMILDIDHFKRFNDRHGHLVGDDALRMVAEILRTSARSSDLVARYGGEEFAIALPGSDASGARKLLHRIEQALMALDPIDGERLTISAGIAEAASGVGITELTRRADEALYAAKDAGRNRGASWNQDGIIVHDRPQRRPLRVLVADGLQAPSQAEREAASSASAAGRPRPSQSRVEDHPVSRRATVAVLLACGLVSMMLSQVLPSTQTASKWQLGAGAAVVGWSIMVGLSKRDELMLKASIIGGIGVISTIMATADPLSMTGSFYLWPAALAAYFCSARFTAASMAWMAVAMAGGLTLSPAAHYKPVVWLGISISVALMAAVIHVMVRQQSQLRQDLEDAAHTDPLTGLRNRHVLTDAIGDAMRDAQAGQQSALIMVDVDHFKQFNDTHGHVAGDQALRRVADILRGCTRSSDIVARFGGEEFAVVLHDSDTSGAEQVAERLGQAFAVENLPDESQRLTASVGIAGICSSYARPEDMISRADEALYAAKNAGRNRSAVAHNQAAGGGISIGEPAAAGLAVVAPRHPRDYVQRRGNSSSEAAG